MTIKQARRLHRSLYTVRVEGAKDKPPVRVRRANYVSFRPWARGAIDAHVAEGKLAGLVGSSP